jgi:ATP-dependent helicase/nuclease subunit B
MSPAGAAENTAEPASVTLVPAAGDLIDIAAAGMVQRYRSQLPDLSALTILVPQLRCLPALRARLSYHAAGALLGPRICTLQQFAAERGDAGLPLPASECRLILLQALRRYRGVFAGQNLWQTADALFSLFEELTLNDCAFDDDEPAFAERLRGLYRARPHSALSREAQIAHRLWRAYLEETAGQAPAASYAAALRTACVALTAEPSAGPSAGCAADRVAERVADRAAGQWLELLGFDTFAGAERAALRIAFVAGRAHVWLHGRADGRDGQAQRHLCAQLGVAATPSPPATSARGAWLDALFDGPACAFPAVPPGLRITACAGPEHEARCVDLAIREALLGGCTRVAVVTEDRRLARRLRALLERAGVQLADAVGWALSTSAAAALINAWLDAAESRFQFRPLLDVLKSPFFSADAAAVTEFERELVERRRIESGLDRYLQACKPDSPLENLLQRVAAAARLMPERTRAWPGQVWTVHLLRVLEALDLTPALRADAAGARLLQVLGELERALIQRPQLTDWHEFRVLLDRGFERATFVPDAAAAACTVQLLTLEQSALLQADAVIVAAATRRHIPGGGSAEPFFNQSVRAELGLPDVQQRHALQMARLRRVLEAAPDVRITYAPDEPGEAPQPCPWIEALAARAAIPPGPGVWDPALAVRAQQAQAEVVASTSVPAVRRAPAEAKLPSALLPRAWSASMHQTLLDCPYRFYAQYCLGLRVPQAPDEDPDRSDYGARVHRILEAFTQPVTGLPPALAEPVTAANRAAARARLEAIADAVFAPDLKARALAQVWLTEFRSIVPALLDWLEQRPAGAARAEVEFRRPFGERFELIGRADRLESRADGRFALIDYKTGQVPAADEVVSGEAVQLLHYALLDERIAQVEYLPLRDPAKPVSLEPELAALTQAAAERLARLQQQMLRWQPLPANGGDTVCRWCDHRGICRKGDWHPAAPDMGSNEGSNRGGV